MVDQRRPTPRDLESSWPSLFSSTAPKCEVAQGQTGGDGTTARWAGESCEKACGLGEDLGQAGRAAALTFPMLRPGQIRTLPRWSARGGGSGPRLGEEELRTRQESGREDGGMGKGFGAGKAREEGGGREGPGTRGAGGADP